MFHRLTKKLLHESVAVFLLTDFIFRALLCVLNRLLFYLNIFSMKLKKIDYNSANFELWKEHPDSECMTMLSIYQNKEDYLLTYVDGDGLMSQIAQFPRQDHFVCVREKGWLIVQKLGQELNLTFHFGGHSFSFHFTDVDELRNLEKTDFSQFGYSGEHGYEIFDTCRGDLMSWDL